VKFLEQQFSIRRRIGINKNEVTADKGVEPLLSINSLKTIAGNSALCFYVLRCVTTLQRKQLNDIEDITLV